MKSFKLDTSKKTNDGNGVGAGTITKGCGLGFGACSGALVFLIALIALGAILSGGGSTSNTNSNVLGQSSSGVNENSQTSESVTNEEPDVPAEYKSALKKAASYASTMYMSKKGVYNQLTSEYGEKFTAEAAQYAIDNVQADWNANALAKAKTYQDTMNMSPAAIHDQLTSENGEQFTQSEADYAIEHLND